MANRGKSKSPVRLVFRHGGRPLMLVLALAIVLSSLALGTLSAVKAKTAQAVEKLQTQAAALEEDHRRLEQNIDALGTVQSVEQIAREELGLVDPDTVVFKP